MSVKFFGGITIVGGVSGSIEPNPTIITDDFNRANTSAGSLGTANEGWTWSSTDSIGAIQVESNTAFKPSTGNNTYRHRSNFDFEVDDQYAQVEASGFVGGPSTLSITVQARTSSSGSTFYSGELQHDAGGNLWRHRIIRVVGGGRTQIGPTISEAIGTYPTIIRLEVIGTSMMFYVGGVLKVDTTDSTITAGKRTGIGWIGGPSFRCDDFEAGELF